MRRRLLLIAMACWLGSPAVGSADPLQIRSGFYFLDFGRNGDWVLQGDGFRLKGEGIAQEAPFWDCRPSICDPGDPISLNARLTLDRPFDTHATAEIGGQSHSNVFWEGEFRFASGTVSAQHGASETRPFTFAGWLRGYLSPDFSGTPFFSGDFVGFGQTTVRFFGQEFSEFGVEVSSVRYEFADPIPEPGTMLLLGTGLAGAFATRRRRRSGIA